MKYAIWGTGGMARAIRKSALESLSVQTGLPSADIQLVFVDEDETRRQTPINGTTVISPEEVFADGDYYFNVSFASAQRRRDVVHECMDRTLGAFYIHDKSARIFDSVSIGEGSILAANTLLTSNISIGRHFHCNIYSYVEHDCEIGDFVTFAPRVSCNGNIRIEDGAYVGSCAVIKQGTFRKPLVIGKNAIIGMGAVVTRNVAEGETVIGVPARVFE